MAHNCLLVICDTIGDYTECLKNLKRYVRPGGHLVVQETLRETKSLIGSKTFKMFPLQYHDVIKCFDEAGFITMETMQLNYNNTDSVFCDSNTGHFSLLKKSYWWGSWHKLCVPKNSSWRQQPCHVTMTTLYVVKCIIGFIYRNLYILVADVSLEVH